MFYVLKQKTKKHLFSQCQLVQKHEIILLWMSREVVDSGTWCSPESCFDLFQSFAFCLWDESYSEDDIEDAHKSKHPEGSSTRQNILKKKSSSS